MKTGQTYWVNLNPAIGDEISLLKKSIALITHILGTGKYLHAWGSRKVVPMVNGYLFSNFNVQ